MIGLSPRSMKIILLLAICLVCGETIVLSAGIAGHVVDGVSGAPIPGANVKLDQNNTVVKTGLHGEFFFRNIEPGRHSLQISATGYSGVSIQKIDIRRNDTSIHTFRIPLAPIVFNTEITVEAKPGEVRFKDVMATELPAELLQDEPGALEDPVKKVQTLPGVVGESDFLSILYVRGGGSDETMLFLDRGYLLNPYHLGGAFTVYAEDLVDKVDFYTGGFPARYGNALSGVLDVTYRSGDLNHFHGMGEFSPITTKFRLEGPIKKGKLSYLLSGRRSYWDFIVKALGKDDDIAAPYFGDLFGKITWFGADRRIALETLWGQDGLERFELDEPLENPDADPGSFYFLNKSRLVNLTWDEWINPIWSGQGTFAYSRSSTRADLTGTEPLSADVDIDFYMIDMELDRETNEMKLSGGIQAGWADFMMDSFLTDYRSQIPGGRKTGNENTDKTDIDFDRPFKFQCLWSEFTWAPDIEREFQLTAGARVDRWDSTGEVTWSPRLNLLMGLTDRLRLRAATGIFYQFPYNIIQTAPGYGNPDLKSERAIHAILGLEGDFNRFLKIRMEGFYKWYDRSIVNYDTEEEALAAALEGKPFQNKGYGFAYGYEFFCQLFPWKIFDGWLTYSYTLTRIRNPLHKVNPEWYYPLQDQRHTLHLILNVRPFEHWVFSGRISYASGRPTTEIEDWELQLDKDPPHFPIWVAQYGSLNAGRLPDYFRLDLRAQFNMVFSKGMLSVYMDLINATNRKNLYVYTYDSGDPPNEKPDQERVNNLPILPIIGVTYRF